MNAHVRCLPGTGEHPETKRNDMFLVFMVFLSTPPDSTAADRLPKLIDHF